MNSPGFLRPLLIFCGLSFLLYARTLSYGYTNFDDNQLILESKAYLSDISNIGDAFRTTVFRTPTDVFYRPVETIWFILNQQAGGEELFVFRLSSILLHGVAVFLIFLLLLRLDVPVTAAWILSGIFLLHPLFVQAVVWIPGVVDILVMCFALLSILSFFEFIRNDRRKDFMLHSLFFFLSLMTKEIAVGIPVMILFYVFLFRRNAVPVSQIRSLAAGWAVLLLIWFLMRDAAVPDGTTAGGKGILGVLTGWIANLPASIQYIGKVLLPLNLSVMPVLHDTSYLFGAFALLIIGGMFYFFRERIGRMVFFGAVWFLVFILPTYIVTSPYRVHQFYEHRMYLPMVGLVLMFASLLPWNSIDWRSMKVRATVAVIMLFFLIVNLRHQPVFSDTENFLQNATLTAPGSSLAFRNLGIFRQEQDRLAEAETAYKRSLLLNPFEKDLHGNLGVIYNRQGKLELAEREYKTELSRNPASQPSWHNLGMLAAGKQQYGMAIECFRKALALRPVKETLEQLALVYQKTGNRAELEKVMKELGGSGMETPAIASSELAVDQARRLMAQGDLPGAERVLKEVWDRDSSDKVVLFHLGLVYYTARQMEDAEKIWRRTLKMDSTYTDAYNNLAICLIQQRKMDDAESILLDLVRHNPDYADGMFNLANFYARNQKEKEAMKYISIMKGKGFTRKYYEERGVRLSKELSVLFAE